MPSPTRPQLALYAAFAIAVLLIGARVLREADDVPAPLPDVGVLGADAAGSDGLAGAAGAAAASGGTATGGTATGAGADPATAGLGAGATAATGAGGGEIVVDVKGAVRRPGVYRLPAGARALDAVRRAGGVTRRADRLAVNLAAPITDGGEVVVPRRGAAGAGLTAAAPGGAATGGASTGGGDADGPLQIDINTASAKELEQLDGVGPATAARIIAYREQHGGFGSIDELDEVPGIGEAKLAAIRAQLGL